MQLWHNNAFKLIKNLLQFSEFQQVAMTKFVTLFLLFEALVFASMP